MLRSETAFQSHSFPQEAFLCLSEETLRGFKELLAALLFISGKKCNVQNKLLLLA